MPQAQQNEAIQEEQSEFLTEYKVWEKVVLNKVHILAEVVGDNFKIIVESKEIKDINFKKTFELQLHNHVRVFSPDPA